MDDYDEQTHEAIAWALASYRLERPESEIFPEEITPQDWGRARVALEAVVNRTRELAADG
jgi:hypothetical protein